MRQERMDKAVDSISDAGLGSFLAFYEENIRYISGTRGPPWTRDKPGLRYSLITEDGDVNLWEQGDNKYQAMRINPWIPEEDIRSSKATWIKGATGPATIEQARRFARDLKEVLEKHGVENEPVGIDFIDLNMQKAFEKEGIEIQDGLGPIHEARAVKTKDEIECERIAASIADSIHWEASKLLEPGIRENELMAKLFDKAYSTPGVDFVETIIVSSGPYTWPNYRSFTDRIIDIGDPVFIDVVIAWNGYHTCHYRTYNVGKEPTDKQMEEYREAYDWLYSAIDKVKPGATTKEVVEQWPSAMEEWGYDSEEEAAANLWGHGLGLSHYDLPLFSRISSIDNPTEIKENMVFALETQQGTKFEHGSRIEEMVLVTDTGPELLTKFPSEEPCVTPR